MKLHRLALAALLILMMTTAVSASPSTNTQSNSGWLSAYDEEPTIDTYIYRLAIGDIELGHDVYLATADCSRIGEVGVITIGDNEPLNYQVFDCLGADAGYDWMARQNIIAEVDFWTWQRYGLGRATMTAGE
jgi:hypothetical protein